MNSQTVSIAMGSSGSGPNGYTLYSSVDGYAASLGTLNTSCSGQQANSITLPSAGFNGLSSVTFRVVGSTTGCSTTFATTGTGGPSSITIGGTAVSTGSAPPTLSAGAATVDAPFNVTFTDGPWRSAITGITVGGTTLTGGYAITAGNIAFTPSASVPTTLLQTAGTKAIAIQATGYTDATVSQVINPGVPASLVIGTQPTAPATSGAVLAAQPTVTVRDQYTNAVLSGVSVTAAVSSGQTSSWSLGGTTTVTTNSSGLATFTNLTATNLTGTPYTTATITFTPGTGSGSVTSTPAFTVPAPSGPTLTAAVGATVDAPFNVTFSDNPTWRGAITSITVGATTLSTGAYTVSAGQITFTPSASALLQTSGSKTITVIATGYTNDVVTQVINPGVPTAVTISPQPAGPVSSGATLATQPQVTLKDQYNNNVTGVNVTATVTPGQTSAWSLGGTVTIASNASGVAVFTNLTATNISGPAYTTATITFTPATGVTTAVSTPAFTVPAASLATDYFKSNVAAGNWSAAASWQSSPDNGVTPFMTATLAPTSSASAINILSGHNITVNSAQSAAKLTVEPGGTLTYSSGTFTIADKSGDDVILQGANSNFIIGTTAPTLSGSANFRIGTGAVLTLSGNTNLSNYHTSDYVYADGGIFEYTNSSTPSVANVTMFSSQDANAIPVFRWNSPLTGSVGSSNPTTINGKVEISSGRTLNLTNLTGTFTLRNGIIGSGLITSGSINPAVITGATAEIGGTGNLDMYFTVANGSVTTLTSDKTVPTSNKIIVNGTLDFGTKQLTCAGTTTFTLGSTGILRTAHANGLTGATASIGSTTALAVMPAGSTVEYYATTAQTITGGLNYHNLILNGNSVKTTSGAITIGSNGETLSDNINAGSMVLGGDITFTTGSVPTFTIASSAILNTGNAANQLTGASGTKIIVNGTFLTQHSAGLYGTGTTVPSIPITFAAGSTLEFGGASQSYQSLGAAQIVSLPTNITFSGSGTKTGGSISTLNPGLITIRNGINVNSASGASFGGSGTALTMEANSLLIVAGSGTQPNMNGAYSLATGSTIQFGGTSATDIRLASPTPPYYNITVSGSNVSTSTNTASIVLASGGTFTVASGGTFKTRSANGFSGSTNTSVNSANSPTIVLDPAGTVEYSEPGNQVITTQLAYGGLRISGTSGTKAAAANAVINVRGNFTKTGASYFNPNGSTINMNGSAATAQTIGTSDSLSFYKLVNNNTVGGVSIDSGEARIYNLLTLSTNSKLAFTQGNMVIRSTAAYTAAVDQVPSGVSITYPTTGGRFIIEKFIKTGRKWQFLSPDATSDANPLSFQQSWMDGQTAGVGGAGYSTGRGMWITGSAAAPAFDAISNTATVKYWNGTMYLPIANVSANIHDQPAYMTYVRGDRGATGPNGVVNTTTLKTTGKILIGNSATTNIPANNAQTAMGNPYAAAINLRNLNTGTLSEPLTINVWDPKLAGNDGLGGFQTITGSQSAGFTISPGGGSYAATAPTPGSTMEIIESGQAFYIQGATQPLAIRFEETAKGAFYNTVSFTGNVNDPQMLGAQLRINPAGENEVADGFLLKFDQQFKDAVDNSDATKMPNTNENISISKDGKQLAVELRKQISGNDTIRINMAGMRQKPYRWSINADNMDEPGREGYLIDKYSGTQKQLNLSGITDYDFSVTGDAASAAADRFMIVFKPAVVLPVTITDIKAKRQTDDQVLVTWSSQNEINIHHYEIQRSADAVAFTSLKNENATANNGGAAAYVYTDTKAGRGASYYRIKAVSNTGAVQYSAIVNVDKLIDVAGIRITPNPVNDQVIHLQMSGQTAGKYALQLMTNEGKIIGKTTVTVSGSFQQIDWPLNNIAEGIYLLNIISPDGQKSVQKVMVR